MGILLAPGPVYVPEELMLAQVDEMITHRSKKMSELYSFIVEWLKKRLNANEAYAITGSGALAIETLFVNLTKEGEKSLVLSNGQFGDNLYKTAKVYTEAEKKELEAGKGWNLERAKEYIDESKATIFAMVYNETGYGVKNDVKDILKYAKKKGMITILDCVSAWPAHPLDMKEFSLDGFASACQKATGVPPGVGYVALSEEASEIIDKIEKPRGYYMDLKRHRSRYQKNNQTPNTPAISIMWAIKKSFELIDDYGFERWMERHKKAGEYVRKRVNDMGFELIAEKGFESWTVTAFKHEKAKEIRKIMFERYGITMVGCKGIYSENGLRIAHMGHFKDENLEIVLDLLEKVKKEV